MPGRSVPPYDSPCPEAPETDRIGSMWGKRGENYRLRSNSARHLCRAASSWYRFATSTWLRTIAAREGSSRGGSGSARVRQASSGRTVCACVGAVPEVAQPVSKAGSRTASRNALSGLAEGCFEVGSNITVQSFLTGKRGLEVLRLSPRRCPEALRVGVGFFSGLLLLVGNLGADMISTKPVALNSPGDQCHHDRKRSQKVGIHRFLVTAAPPRYPAGRGSCSPRAATFS